MTAETRSPAGPITGDEIIGWWKKLASRYPLPPFPFVEEHVERIERARMFFSGRTAGNDKDKLRRKASLARAAAFLKLLDERIEVFTNWFEELARYERENPVDGATSADRKVESAVPVWVLRLRELKEHVVKLQFLWVGPLQGNEELRTGELWIPAARYVDKWIKPTWTAAGLPVSYNRGTPYAEFLAWATQRITGHALTSNNMRRPFKGHASRSKPRTPGQRYITTT
jgi:hypothetical protein